MVQNAIQKLKSFKATLEKEIPSGAMSFAFNDILRQLNDAAIDNPKLEKCTEDSICTAVRFAIQLGLNIHGPLRQAYVVPYEINGKFYARFDIQYQGLIELLMRTGLYTKVVSKVVCENDHFEVDEEDNIIHKYSFRRGAVIGFYAWARHINGEKYSEILSKEEMDDLEKDTRKGANMTPAWKKFYNEMGRKVVIKRLIKHLPKNDGKGLQELDKAIKIDNENHFAIENTETLTIEAGKAQLEEMQKQEALEPLLEKLTKLCQIAQGKLDPKIFDAEVSKIDTNDLQSIRNGIDRIQTLIS